jgi:hypothetical protein
VATRKYQVEIEVEDDGSYKIKKFGDEVDKSADRVSRAGEGMNRAFTRVAGAMAAAFSLRQIKTWVTSTINAADRTAKLSQATGVAVEQLTAYSLSAELGGTTTDAVARSINILSKNMFDTANGTGEAKDAFEALDIEVVDANGNLKSSDQIIREIADKFKNMEDGAGKAAIAQRLLGRSGAELIPMLNAGSEGLDEMAAKAEALGLVFDRETAAAAEKVNDNFTIMKKAGEGVVTQIVTGALPTMKNLTNIMADTAGNAEDLQIASDALATSLKALASAGVLVKSIFKAAGQYLGATAAAISFVIEGDLESAKQVVKDWKSDFVGEGKDAAETLTKIWSEPPKKIAEATQKAAEESKKVPAPTVNTKETDEARKKLEEFNEDFKKATLSKKDYERDVLKRQYDEYEKYVTDRAAMDRWYQAELAKVDASGGGGGGGTNRAVASAKKLAEERLRIQENLVRETNRIRMTDTQYAVWELENQVDEYRKKYGEITGLSEYEAAKRREIMDQKLEAEREFAIQVAELHDHTTARAIANIERQKQVFIQSGIDRAAAEKLAQEQIQKVNEESSTSFVDAWNKSIKNINENTATGASAFNSLANIGAGALNRLNSVLLDNSATVSEWASSVIRQLADVALQMSVVGLVGWAGGGGLSSLFETTVWSSGTGMSWVAAPWEVRHGGGRSGIDPAPVRYLPSWMLDSAPRYHLGVDEVPTVLKVGERVQTEGQVAAEKAAEGQTQALLRELISAVQNQDNSVTLINAQERFEDWLYGRGKRVMVNWMQENKAALGR